MDSEYERIIDVHGYTVSFDRLYLTQWESPGLGTLRTTDTKKERALSELVRYLTTGVCDAGIRIEYAGEPRTGEFEAGQEWRTKGGDAIEVVGVTGYFIEYKYKRWKRTRTMHARQFRNLVSGGTLEVTA